ncbi:MAG: hypothetical protein JWM27_4197 [Gemmatimonadetes bacterium]|nr:hypothetical protein [Gemmatimonadota bacterium]
MRKLHLDDLAIESFATTPDSLAGSGTVHGQEDRTASGCPESWNGTCWITCWDSCGCETDVC